MEPSTNTDAGTMPAPTFQTARIETTRRHGLIESTTRHGLNARVWMHSPTMFNYTIHETEDRPDDEAIYVHGVYRENAGMAAREAEAWCAAEAERRAHAEAADGADAPLFVMITAGWHISLADDRGGTRRAIVCNDETGEVAPEDFRGFVSGEAAVEAAAAWARANPCDGSAVDEHDAPAPTSPAEEMATALEPAAANDEPAPVASAEPVADAVDELTLLRRQLAARDADLVQVRQQLVAQAADLDESSTTAREMAQLAEELGDLEDELQVTKDAIKAKKSRLDLLSGKLAKATLALSERKKPPAYQRALPLDASATVAADAVAFAEQLAHPVGWAFNGKEYTIDVEPVATGGYSAWLRGRRATTEGLHETVAGAIEEAKGRASTVLGDAEPGESIPMDAGDAATPARLPAKKPSLQLKGRDVAAVTEVLRKSKEVVEAIETLGCTRKQLESYARRAELDIGALLNTVAAELPPAPAETVKPRGRKGRGK